MCCAQVMVVRPNLFTFERIKEAVQQPAFRSRADKIGVLGQAGPNMAGALLMHAVENWVLQNTLVCPYVRIYIYIYVICCIDMVWP